jgi:hypothetical protein
MNADLTLLLQEYPGDRLKFEGDHQFMQEVVFTELKNLNTGFDSPLIFHFSPSDFATVIDRCEHLNVQIIGIEVFEVLSGSGGFLEVEISPDDGYGWARRLVQAYMGKPNITLSATFKVPDALLI